MMKASQHCCHQPHWFAQPIGGSTPGGNQNRSSIMVRGALTAKKGMQDAREAAWNQMATTREGSDLGM